MAEYANGYVPVVRLNVPELYRDRAFMEWLNDPRRNSATWHRAGHPANDYSDIFMTVDGCLDGSDSDMPEDCWDYLMERLVAIVPQPYTCEILVWLTNLEDHPDPESEYCLFTPMPGFVSDDPAPDAPDAPPPLPRPRAERDVVRRRVAVETTDG